MEEVSGSLSDSLGGAAPFWHPQNNDSGDYISASSTNSHYIPIDEEDEDSDTDSDDSSSYRDSNKHSCCHEGHCPCKGLWLTDVGA